MSARAELWARVDACLDRGADPRADEGVLALLDEEPQLAGELADALAALALVRRGAPARRGRMLPFALASAAAAALLALLLRLEPSIPAETAPAPIAATVELRAYRVELASEGPRGARRVVLELEGGRLRERHVERVLPPTEHAGELRTALVVETSPR